MSAIVTSHKLWDFQITAPNGLRYNCKMDDMMLSFAIDGPVNGMIRDLRPHLENLWARREEMNPMEITKTAEEVHGNGR